MPQTIDDLINELEAQSPERPVGAVEAISKPVQQQATQAPKATGLSEYYLNRAARSALGEGTQSILEMVLPKTIMEPVSAGAEAIRARLGFPKMATPATGGEGRLQAQMGNVVSGATDPLSYLPIGKAPLAMRAVEGFFGAAGGELGGTVGGAVGGPTGQVVGGLLGGGVGGTVPQKVGVAKDIGKAGIERIKQGAAMARGGELPETAKEAIEATASGYVSNIFKAAAAADPNFLKKLQENMSTSGAIGVNTPILNLVDNPVIKSEVEGLLARYPKFKAQYADMWEQAKDVVEKRGRAEFGAPEIASQVKMKSAIAPAQKTIIKKIGAIDKAIQKVGDKYDTTIDNQQLGAKIDGLISAKEDAAMAAVAPSYKSAFDYAKEKGLTLPAESVDALYSSVKDEKVADVFKTFPALFRKVESVFKPTVGEGLDFNPQTLELAQKTVAEFSAKSIEDLDSLKRELNRSIRSTKDETNLRILYDFKDKVQGAIESVDPTFASMYKGADTEYYKTVGIPFNSETAKMVSRAKFDEHIVPMITRNKSMLQEMLKATGEEGAKIAEAAFMQSFGKYAVPDGVLNPKKASKWIKENDAAISLVPGLKEKLLNDKTVVSDLELSKTILSANFARAKAADILGAEGMTAKQIVDKSTSDPAFLTTLLKKHGGDTESLQAIRSFALDNLLSSKNPLDVLNDKVKGPFYNRIFEGRMERIKQLADVSGQLSRFSPDDISIVIKNAVPKDALEKVTSVPGNTAFSVLRDRIMSPIQKVFVLLNKGLTGMSARRQDEMLQEVLINPKEVEKYAIAAQKVVDGGKLTQEEAITFLKKSLQLANRYVKPGEGAIRGAAVGAETQATAVQEGQQQQPQNIDDLINSLEQQ